MRRISPHASNSGRRAAALVAAFLLLIGLSAARAQDWQTFQYPEDGFSAAFPSAPREDSHDVETLSGDVELHSYTLEIDKVALFIGVSDYGPKAQENDVDVMLQGAKNGALRHSQARLTRESKISLGPYRGIEFESESDDTHYITRIYMAGTVMYQTLVVAPASSPYADTKRFLDSFQIIEREPDTKPDD